MFKVAFAARRMPGIPGNGNQKVAFTHTGDIERFVGTLSDVPEWERRYNAIGGRLTLNQVVQIAKKVIHTSFDKKYDSEEDLAQGKCTLLPRLEEAEGHDNDIVPIPFI